MKNQKVSTVLLTAIFALTLSAWTVSSAKASNTNSEIARSSYTSVADTYTIDEFYASFYGGIVLDDAALSNTSVADTYTIDEFYASYYGGITLNEAVSSNAIIADAYTIDEFYASYYGGISGTFDQISQNNPDDSVIIVD